MLLQLDAVHVALAALGVQMVTQPAKGEQPCPIVRVAMTRECSWFWKRVLQLDAVQVRHEAWGKERECSWLWNRLLQLDVVCGAGTARGIGEGEAG